MPWVNQYPWVSATNYPLSLCQKNDLFPVHLTLNSWPIGPDEHQMPSMLQQLLKHWLTSNDNPNIIQEYPLTLQEMTDLGLPVLNIVLGEPYWHQLPTYPGTCHTLCLKVTYDITQIPRDLRRRDGAPPHINLGWFTGTVPQSIQNSLREYLAPLQGYRISASQALISHTPPIPSI